jgi:16S rRNA (uracil1498-N3)-methyltransferase
MNIYYIPDVVGDTARLDETESGHAIRVMRLVKGDQILVTDGKGTWYDGIISVPHPKRCEVVLTPSDRNPENRNYQLTLAVAPTKNSDRLEWFVEKATEIGIDRIIPIRCRFSERKSINRERLEKIAVSAMKQSLKANLPAIVEIAGFSELISMPFDGRKLIAHCYPGEKANLFRTVQPGEKVLVLIGPEGDFSPDEVEAAIEAGFQEVSLGDFRLRTETAALVACHTVALVNQY